MYWAKPSSNGVRASSSNGFIFALRDLNIINNGEKKVVECYKKNFW